MKYAAPLGLALALLVALAFFRPYDVTYVDRTIPGNSAPFERLAFGNGPPTETVEGAEWIPAGLYEAHPVRAELNVGALALMLAGAVVIVGGVAFAVARRGGQRAIR